MEAAGNDGKRLRSGEYPSLLLAHGHSVVRSASDLGDVILLGSAAGAAGPCFVM